MLKLLRQIVLCTFTPHLLVNETLGNHCDAVVIFLLHFMDMFKTSNCSGFLLIFGV